MRLSTLLLLITVANAACSDWPTSPTGLAGHSVSITNVGRPWERTQLLSVDLEFELAEPLNNAMVWTCLARTTDTVYISSCRGKAAFGLAGNVKSETGPHYVNRVPVFLESRYVMAFLTSGELHGEKSYPPPGERDIEDLTRKIAARTTIEMVWTWDPF